MMQNVVGWFGVTVGVTVLGFCVRWGWWQPVTPVLGAVCAAVGVANVVASGREAQCA